MYRKKKYPSRKPRAGAALNVRQKRQVKNIVSRQVELKQFDTTNSALGIASTGTFVGPFAAIPQGSADNYRVSDRLHMKRLWMRWTCVFGDATNFLRVVVFQWKANNATITPSVNAILQNPGAPFLSPMNDTNQGTLFTLMYVCFNSLIDKAFHSSNDS